MNGILRTLALSFVLALAASPAMSAAEQADPAIGTWSLNLAKSTYHGNTAPKSQTRVYAVGSAGTDEKITGVAADGSAISQSQTITYDGKDCAVTGNVLYDTLAVKKINGSTVKSEWKKNGQIVGHTTRVISGHGQVMTLSSSYKTAKGGTVHYVAVYDKQ